MSVRCGTKCLCVWQMAHPMHTIPSHRLGQPDTRTFRDWLAAEDAAASGDAIKQLGFPSHPVFLHVVLCALGGLNRADQADSNGVRASNGVLLRVGDPPRGTVGSVREVLGHIGRRTSEGVMHGETRPTVTGPTCATSLGGRQAHPPAGEAAVVGVRNVWGVGRDVCVLGGRRSPESPHSCNPPHVQ